MFRSSCEIKAHCVFLVDRVSLCASGRTKMHSTTWLILAGALFA